MLKLITPKKITLIVSVFLELTHSSHTSRRMARLFFLESSPDSRVGQIGLLLLVLLKIDAFRLFVLLQGQSSDRYLSNL